MNTRYFLLILAGLAILDAGCATLSSPKPVHRRWGSMAEVLKEGRTHGRVDLGAFVGRDDVVGVGALENLAGEVTIADGAVWIARATGPDDVTTTRVERGGTEAALLFTAQIDGWAEVVIGHAIAPGDFERELGSMIEAFGHDTRAPVPFVIDGELTGLDLHVIAGECPVRAAAQGREPARPPFRLSGARRTGRLVGFYADGAHGVVTHHGSNVHVHAMLEDATPLTGHVDAVGLAPGGADPPAASAFEPVGHVMSGAPDEADRDQLERSRTVSRILRTADDAEPRRADELLPLVYDELRALARARVAREAPGQTIQATVLVHEAYMRLVGNEDPGWNGRGHFFGAAALAMRRILVEQARRKGRIKHGGGRKRVELSDANPEVPAAIDPPVGDDVLAVDEIVRRLEAQDERKGRIVNLRYFAGLTAEETARALGVSLGTVEREWRFIKAWLQVELARSREE